MKLDPKHDPKHLPEGLPVPIDDGACRHLGNPPFDVMPKLALRCTNGVLVNLQDIAQRPLVLFFYPRTGVPGQVPELGFGGEDWDSVPGARGCTPQSCGFRDSYAEFEKMGIAVYGVSTNTTAHQREFKTRMHIPFEILNDSELRLVRALRLPTFEWPLGDGEPNTLVKRMAMVVTPDADGIGRIRKVWYPVFPPNENAANVLAWLADPTNVIAHLPIS